MSKRFPFSPKRAVVSAAVLGIVSGCSTNFDSVMPDRRPDYRQSQLAAQPLEVPPDLTASTIDDTLLVPELNPTGSASLSLYASERDATQRTSKPTAVLPQQPGVQLEQDGNQRWLVVDAPADQVWSKVRGFWVSNGLALKRDDPTIGIMETDWVENRADIPESGIRSLLKTYLDVLYSAPTRDKFRVRLERTDDDKHTAVYMTHYGVEQVGTSDGISTRTSSSTFMWQRRPSNPELEAEMLNRLMVYLGAEEKRAEIAAQHAKASGAATTENVPRTRLVEEGSESRLIINEDYSRAWRLVGLALDGSNYAVEEQQRSQGLYVVEYRDPRLENQEGEKGFFAKMAFWRSEDQEAPPVGTRYRVRLAGQGEQTTVVVRDSNDQPDNSAGAKQILGVLQQVIR